MQKLSVKKFTKFTFIRNHLCHDRSCDDLLFWSIQECADAIPKRTDIISHLREAVAAAHQTGRGYKSKPFGAHH